MFKRIKSNINVRNEKYGNRSEEFLWRAYQLTGYEREKKNLWISVLKYRSIESVSTEITKVICDYIRKQSLQDFEDNIKWSNTSILSPRR